MTLADEPSLLGLKVLLVEDDADARSLVSRILSDEGITVVAAASGADGLSILEVTRPDVIVSDIAMSGLDGYAFLHETRRREDVRGAVWTPAIALTAYDDTVHLMRAGRAGFQRHLSKPIDADRLLRTVAELCGRSWVRSGPAVR
jgi:CheY-like chemotaxis protein